MSESKHTPGPWTAAEADQLGGWSVTAPDPFEGAEPGDLYNITGGTMTDANARLIAAAPDLLQALREVLASVPLADEPEFADRFAAATHIAFAAIRKAQGG